MLEAKIKRRLRNGRIQLGILALVLCVVWSSVAWIYGTRIFQSRSNSFIVQEQKHSDLSVQNVVADLQRSLRTMQGLPSIIAANSEIIDALRDASLVSRRIKNESEKERAARIRQQNTNAQWMHINQILLNAKNRLSFDIAFVLDASGDSPASSNYDKPESIVGNNLREREYFRSAINGQLGYQYAIGKVTHTGGLYFSAPVVDAGKVIGVVVIKIEIAHLVADIGVKGINLIDENGVVIWADDKRQELNAVEGGAILTFNAEKRRTIYRRENFPLLEIKAWPDNRYQSLYRIGSENTPVIVSKAKLLERDLHVWSAAPVPSIAEFDFDMKRWIFIVVCSGCLFIFLILGAIYYLLEHNRIHYLIKAQRDRLDEAQRMVMMGSWYMNLETKEISCSESARLFFLIAPFQSRLNYDSMIAAIHPEDRMAVVHALQEAIKSGSHYHHDYRIVHGGGDVRYIAADGIVKKQNKSDSGLLEGTLRDVTEYKLLLNALRTNETYLKNVINSCLIGIVQGGNSGELLGVNHAFERLTGYTEEEFSQNKLTWRSITPEKFHQIDLNAFDELHMNGTVPPYEKELICQNGQILPVLIGVAQIEERKNEWVGFVLDLSERNRVARLQSDFISVVSHELRTPLTAIRGSLSLLEGGVLGELPEKAAEFVAVAHRNSKRLSNLVNDILDMDKINAGKMKFDMRPVDLVELLKQAIEVNKDYASNFNVRFEFVCTLMNARVWGDFDRLLQVVTNLMSNAAKFSPEGGNVRICLKSHDQQWRIEVIDDGDGIPEQFQQSIFGNFAQADHSNTRQKQGSGLGLRISKSMVEMMQGEIGFETAHGKGTCFWLHFKKLHAES